MCKILISGGKKSESFTNSHIAHIHMHGTGMNRSNTLKININHTFSYECPVINDTILSVE